MVERIHGKDEVSGSSPDRGSILITMTQSTPKRLYKNKKNAMIFGVCQGIAEYFNVDPTLVRIGTVVGAMLWGTGIVAYVICAIVMPDKTEIDIDQNGKS